MITLIGTGHVFNLAQPLLNIFDEKQPNIICIELDQQRYNAMMMKQADLKAYKNAQKNVPIIYKLLARFQEGMAEKYGVTAGQEMLTAINYTQSHQLPLAFIDMNAQKMFTRMLKSMSFSEKFKLFLTGFGGLFISKKQVEKELKNFEGDFDSYIEQIGKKFPTIKKVLIDERNEYMLNKLIEANEQHEKVIAVMGDGHISGISELLKSKKVEFESIRLSELRNQNTTISDSSTASFTTGHKEL